MPVAHAPAADFANKIDDHMKANVAGMNTLYSGAPENAGVEDFNDFLYLYKFDQSEFLS